MHGKLSMIGLVACLGLIIPAMSCAAPVETMTPLTSFSGTVTVTRYLEDPPPFTGMTSAGLYKLEPTQVEITVGFPEYIGEMMVY